MRGLRGGYRLAQPPGDVSLGEILEVVEGKFTLVDCVNDFAKDKDDQADAHECLLIGICPSKNPMRLVHERIGKLFASIRLDELCGLTGVAATEDTR